MWCILRKFLKWARNRPPPNRSLTGPRSESPDKESGWGYRGGAF